MAETTGTSTTKINSYLTFKLGEEEFAAHVGKVLNILEMTKITDVPRAPEYMKGVINLRGSVLPVVDTRIKFGMTPPEFTPHPRTPTVAAPHPMVEGTEDGDYYRGRVTGSTQAQIDWVRAQRPDDPSLAGARAKATPTASGWGTKQTVKGAVR